MESKANTHKGESRKCRRNVQNDLYVEIGKRLRISRIELNYTQEQRAEILEMSSAFTERLNGDFMDYHWKSLLL